MVDYHLGRFADRQGQVAQPEALPVLDVAPYNAAVENPSKRFYDELGDIAPSLGGLGGAKSAQQFLSTPL